MQEKRFHETERMKELIARIHEADEAYYAQNTEIMSNREYDALCDELKELERKTGTVMEGSPSTKVSGKPSKSLPKERHETPMLSLDKTKDEKELRGWLAKNGPSDGNPTAVLSWKMDGLTVVLTYEHGRLAKAVTRGNGEIGEVVTANALRFLDLPETIEYKGKLVARGEAVIHYADFEAVNACIPDETAKYKNPRNLCSGSVRQLDPEVTKSRNVRFYAFELVSMERSPDVTESAYEYANRTYGNQLDFLDYLGFRTVGRSKVSEHGLMHGIHEMQERIGRMPFPSDGLVLRIDDNTIAQSLGTTGKYPKYAMAFKWQDETEETTLRGIEWSPSRTGLINPIAVFDPVELEGTTVSRASLHNLGMLESLKLGIGDTVMVYKANMIIPQIDGNLTGSDTWPETMPKECPACGQPTKIHASGEKGTETKTLRCDNPDCPAKRIKAFAHMVKRDALDVQGLSESTLEKLIGAGLIHGYADLFRLGRHRDAITGLEGFGEASCENLLAAVEKARETELWRTVYALGIPGIGRTQSRSLCDAYPTAKRLLNAMGGTDPEPAMGIADNCEGIGDTRATALVEWFRKERNRDAFLDLLSELRIKEPDMADGKDAKPLVGLTFAVTGALERYGNRDALKAAIEAKGGKVSGSVSKNTTALINNDAASSSGKNKKARELGIPILTERDFMERYMG